MIIKVILAFMSFLLARSNMDILGNDMVGIYWSIVCAYWVLNVLAEIVIRNSQNG